MPLPPPAPSATPSEPDALAGVERALLDVQLEALGRLAEMGMAIAGAIERRVTAEGPRAGPDTALSHAALDFSRVSRAVRMTFALQSRLIADFKGVGERAGRGEAPYSGPVDVVWGRPDIVDHDEVKKRQVSGAVQRLAAAAFGDDEVVERLVREAGERLEDEDLYDRFTQRPLGETVALVCQDLGLEPDWSVLADAYWAKFEIQRPPPGSPYAGWAARASHPAPAAPPPFAPSG